MERKELVNHILDTTPIEIQTKSLKKNALNLIELDLYSESERLLVQIEISVISFKANYTITVRSNADNLDLTAVGETRLPKDSTASCTLSKVGGLFVVEGGRRGRRGGRRLHKFGVKKEEISCFRFTETDTASQRYRVLEGEGTYRLSCVLFRVSQITQSTSIIPLTFKIFIYYIVQK